MFPWLRKVLSTNKRKPLVDSSGKVSDECADLFVRVAHVSASAARAAGQGVGMVLRIRAFVVRLFLAMQSASCDALVQALATLRAAAATSPGKKSATVVAFVHSWDETKQMLRQPRLTTAARQSTQPVGRNIMVQKSMVIAHAKLEDVGEVHNYSRAESIIVPPMELYGKSSAFIVSGLRRGMQFPAFCKDAVHRLAEAGTTFVLTFIGDAAASNRRAMKHIVGQSEKDEWPANVLLDVGQVCMLHQVHRIKTGVVDVHNTVSNMFCLSKLVRAGSVMPLVADYIADSVARRCQRIIAPPPPESVAKAKAIMDLLYKLDAPHHLLHGKRGVRKSGLARDIQELLDVDNGAFAHGGDELVHYCWDGRGGPCCPSQEAAVDRMTAAFLNMCVGHAVPVATLSRWTHIGTVCTMLCTSFAFHDVLRRALIFSFSADDKAEQLAAQELVELAVGAGDGDVQTQHMARVAKVRRWLERGETKLQVTTLLLMLQVLDGVTYYLMGGERAEGEHIRPGSSARPEQALPAKEFVERVRRALLQLAELLQDYTDECSTCNIFFNGMGIRSEVLKTDGAMRDFRRQIVGASSGLFRRLSLRLQTFPVKLWMLVAPSIGEELRRQVAHDFLAMRPCCVGIFGKALQRKFPTVQSLLGTEGRCVIQGWLSTLQWAIYSCEKEHASCRRLAGAGGPGRSWPLVARERVMESARALHLERVGMDPALMVQARGAKRHAPAEAGERDQPQVRDPLAGNFLHMPPPALSWSTQAEALAQGHRPSAHQAGVRPQLAPLADEARAGVGGDVVQQGRARVGQVVVPLACFPRSLFADGWHYCRQHQGVVTLWGRASSGGGRGRGDSDSSQMLHVTQSASGASAAKHTKLLIQLSVFVRSAESPLLHTPAGQCNVRAQRRPGAETRRADMMSAIVSC